MTESMRPFTLSKNYNFFFLKPRGRQGVTIGVKGGGRAGWVGGYK